MWAIWLRASPRPQGILQARSQAGAMGAIALSAGPIAPSGASLGTLQGVLKKFAAQPRRETIFTKKRGVKDVTLLNQPLTQPLANRSCCL